MMNKNKRSGRPWLPIPVIAVRVMIIPLILIAGGRVAADPLLAAPPESAVRRIVLDPGHGGHDTGVESPEGVTEKRVTFALAEALKGQLGPGCKVMMTRTGDYGLGLRERSSLANHHNADLFISLHAGASSRRAVNRWTIYYDASGESDEKHLLQQQIPPFDWNRLQQRHVQSAAKLAVHLKKRLTADLPDQEVEIVPAPLAVLQGVDLPAVLIEAGYLTHPATAREMVQAAGVRRAARAIAEGIADYLENN